MSIKRMITKLALAFAAKKGVEVFRSMGGLSGLKSSLQGLGEQTRQPGGIQGRIGGATDARTGGLGSVLDSLGMAGATDPREAGVSGQISPANPSLGALFGGLASALGHRSEAETPAREFEEQFNLQDVEADQDARPILRAMVQVARADGAIDTEEQQTLLDILDDASPEERAILQTALREPIDPQAVAAATPQYARKEAYSAALLVGDLENESERHYLSSFATALGLSSHETAELHRAMGKVEPVA